MVEDYSINDPDLDLETQDLASTDKEIAYYAPTSLEDVEKLKKQDSSSRYLAGGTVLNWKGAPGFNILIDLKNLHLNKLELSADRVYIGATVTIQELVEEPKLPKPLLTAAKEFNSRNIRNIATVGGTATGIFFVSDILPVFLAYNADVEYFNNGKKESKKLKQWLTTKPGIICAIIISDLNRKVSFNREKVAKMDYPLIVTSIGYQINTDTITDPVIAISGVRNNIVLSETGAAYLADKKIIDIKLEDLNSEIQKDLDPTNNVKANAEVKRKMIASHVKSLVLNRQ